MVGGVVLGGLLGNTIGRDIDCDDQPVAFRVYADGLNGDIGRPYEWNNRGNRGTFTSMREYPPRRHGLPRIHRNHLSPRGELHPHRHRLPRDRHGNWRFD